MRTSPTLFGNVGFVLALILLGLLALLGWRTQRALVETDHNVRTGMELITELQATMSSLQDVESGARGYVITGDDEYLEPYYTGLKELQVHRAALAGLLKDRPERARWLATTQVAIDFRVEHANQIVEAVRKEGSARGVDMIREGTGKRAMEHVRTLIAELETEERRRLLDQHDDVEVMADRGLLFGVLGSVGALSLLLLAMYAVNRSARRNARALVREDAQKRFLRTTVDTDDNLIAVRDADGRFSLCNTAFAELLALDPSRVEGRKVGEITHSDLLAPLLAGDEAVLAGHDEWRGHRIDVTDALGVSRCFQVIKRPIEREDGGRQVLTVGVDVTAQLRAEKLKNEFISTVSHELRTPLTSIRGALSMVSSGMAGDIPASAMPLIDIGTKNTDRLVRLINDILDIEKLESGRLQMQARPLQFAPLVTQAIDQIQPYARDFDVMLEVTGTGSCWVEVDPDRFGQIMANLLSNAIKHSPRGGTVTVEMIQRDEGIEVAVQDRGAGIPADFQKRVFERFAQADSTDTRQRGGTGLGLAITRSLVEQMGGGIGFKSEEGAGTRFMFWLPATAERENTPSMQVQTDRDRVVLLLDDNASADELSRLLTIHGYAVDVATDVESAREHIAHDKVSGVAIDVSLPNDAGPAFLRELREDPQTRHLPALLIGVQGSAPDGLRGGGVGVVDWLAKPIEPMRVAHAVRSCLRRSARDLPDVLHVEDDPDVRHLLASLLENEQLRLHQAETIAEAREHLAARPHDLVILDLMLPDGDGAELLPELGAARPPVPTIIFSAQDLDLPESRVVMRRLVKSRSDATELASLIKENLERWPMRAASKKEP